MTYSSGSTILASDYNGFTTTAGGLNDIWATGSGDKGWGQTAFTAAAVGGTVTATQWAQLVNNLATSGTQTNTTLTARSAPTAGQTITILSALATDITNVTTNRGNAAASGTQYGTFSGTTSKTTATGSGTASWTITFTHTITFPSADQARYFWNAGGIVRIIMGKSSTGTDKDPDWNTFVGTVGTLNMTGRVNSAAQTISGTSYTGFTRVGGSGTPSPNLTTTGWYTLVAGAAATTMWQLNEGVYPYGSDYIRITAAKNAGATTLTLVTTWFDNGAASTGGKSSNISGGTATASPSTTITGTAPTVLVTYLPPSTTLTNSWGTPTITAAVA
jgi:hypothetical protein